MKIDWGWFRVGTFHKAGFISVAGYTLGWKDLRHYARLYSERNGLVACWKLGNWLWTWRTPESGFHW